MISKTDNEKTQKDKSKDTEKKEKNIVDQVLHGLKRDMILLVIFVILICIIQAVCYKKQYDMPLLIITAVSIFLLVVYSIVVIAKSKKAIRKYENDTVVKEYFSDKTDTVYDDINLNKQVQKFVGYGNMLEDKELRQPLQRIVIKLSKLDELIKKYPEDFSPNEQFFTYIVPEALNLLDKHIFMKEKVDDKKPIKEVLEVFENAIEKKIKDVYITENEEFSIDAEILKNTITSEGYTDEDKFNI